MSQQPSSSDCVPSRESSDDWLYIEEDQQYVLEDVKRLPYKHEKMLGLGSSAYVEQVRDKLTGEVYAKKTCIFSDMRSRHDKEEFFNNEIRITRLLKGHRHIVRLYATYVAQTEIGLMLQPAADGDSLQGYLSRYTVFAGNSVPPGNQKYIMTQALEQAFGCLADGLAYIHSKGIRHRDIKPQNILMHRHSVVIADFGSSRNTAQLGKDTTEGHVDFQTRRYSAPEVLNCSERSYEADVYSLGCVFIEMLFAFCQPINYDLNANYAQIMDRIYDLIDHAKVAPRYQFLKDVIRSMTKRTRSERSGIDVVYQELSRQSRFRCPHCSANCARTEQRQPLSYSDWKWDPAQSRYFCYILDHHNDVVGCQWHEPPETKVIDAGTSRRIEAVSSTMDNAYSQQPLLIPGQPSSSNMYSGIDLEVPKYRRVHPSSYADFYTLGRVFKMIWTESNTTKPNGSGKSKASSHISFETTAAGDLKEVRKFVVIKNKGVYSQCIPIQHHRRGSTLNNAGVVYTSSNAPEPHRDEVIDKQAIRVDAAAGQTLRKEARLNYSKHTSVEHNVKVVDIGMVVEEHRYMLGSYFDNAMP